MKSCLCRDCDNIGHTGHDLPIKAQKTNLLLVNCFEKRPKITFKVPSSNMVYVAKNNLPICALSKSNDE